MVNLIIYCLPALGWGLMPIIAKKAGGNPFEQLIGTTVAAVLFAVTINLFSDVNYTALGVMVSFISGIFWAFGQILQFAALKKSEVSKVMPISNDTQLLFTSLSSGIILSEWKSPTETLASIVVIFLLLIAMYLFSVKGHQVKEAGNLTFQIILIISSSSMFLMGYVTITNFFWNFRIKYFLTAIVRHVFFSANDHVIC
ncbi:MAG: GRP family sugar transporter [Enterococcus lemanii]|jgi:glucose uptake protein